MHQEYLTLNTLTQVKNDQSKDNFDVSPLI